MKTEDIKKMALAWQQVSEAKKKKLDPVDKDELKGDYDDRDDKDIDNDGDTDKSDEYLHNRRKTVKKAMKKDDEVEVTMGEATANRKAVARALANIKAQPKDKVSLKKAPWDKDDSKMKKESVELDEASDKVSQIQNYLKSKGGSTTKVVKGKDKDGSAKFTEIMPNNQKIIDSLKSRFQVQVVNYGPNKKALLVREEVEQIDEAKATVKQQKALKALMTRALGGKKAKPGYTSAIANNGDFVVHSGSGNIVGRIKSGEYTDPLKESNSWEVYSRILENRAQRYKSSTDPETMDDKFKGAGAKKAKSDLETGAKYDETEEKGHTDAVAAGKAGPNAKSRNGDNKSGDKSVINKPVDVTQKGQG